MESNAGKIIVVDDEPILMQAICDTLRDYGYDTVGYTSAVEALQAFDRDKFDLLLTDLSMPDIDGISLLQRASIVDNNIVGIIMTGHASIDSAVESMKQGALDYILKPFKLKDVLPVLNRAMSVRQLRIQNMELTENLRNHALELESINKDLEAFSSSISHDLRAPLNFIRNFTGMIRQENEPLRLEKLITQIDRNVAHMEGLIVSLLDFARSGRSALRKSHVDMKALTKRVIEQCMPPDSKYKIEVSAVPSAFCDELLIFQVLVNLISNAVKYSGKKDNPVIAVGSESDKGELVYYVRDNGDGFNLDATEKLFEPFQRYHTENEFEGTGVGLAIVKRIITRHGGRVWAKGQKGIGATFYFSLPGVP